MDLSSATAWWWCGASSGAGPDEGTVPQAPRAPTSSAGRTSPGGAWGHRADAFRWWRGGYQRRGDPNKRTGRHAGRTAPPAQPRAHTSAAASAAAAAIVSSAASSSAAEVKTTS
ncbi:hypothetical protein FTX61_03155 [Nitriliruptoraceae bacterium ZYF776]|nr:hypothetical protein [Profundirhabdus halotolerans]